MGDISAWSCKIFRRDILRCKKILNLDILPLTAPEIEVTGLESVCLNFDATGNVRTLVCPVANCQLKPVQAWNHRCNASHAKGQPHRECVTHLWHHLACIPH